MEELSEEPTVQEIEEAETLAELGRMQAEVFPKLIFKYRALATAQDLARTLDILHNCRLFMPTAMQLNDPFEGRNVDCLSEEANRALVKAKERHRILALSQDCFSAPLWAHYAANGNGVCIGFYTDYSFSNIDPVEYASTIDKKQCLCFEQSQALALEYKYKNSDWSYEKEYRIQQDTDALYFEFKPEEIACVALGEKLGNDVRSVLELSTCSLDARIFDLKSDINRSRYYFIPCEEPARKLYEIEELYDYLASTRPSTNSRF